MKKYKIKKKTIIFLTMLFVSVAIGSTYAYYYNHYVIENKFNTSDYNVSLSEYFPKDTWDEDNSLDKQVSISNNGSADVLLRISYNEMWYDEKENLNNLYNGNEIVTKNWNEDFDDFIYHNGWYYYEKVLSSGDSVSILDSITKNYDVYNDEGIKYQLDFNYEVLQVENYASERVWGYKSSIQNGIVSWTFND